MKILFCLEYVGLIKNLRSVILEAKERGHEISVCFNINRDKNENSKLIDELTKQGIIVREAHTKEYTSNIKKAVCLHERLFNV